jgi:transposase-like protein
MDRSLAPSTLAYWVKAYKEGKLGDVGKAQKPLTEVEMELGSCSLATLPNRSKG